MNILDSQIGEILRYRDVNDFWRMHNIPSRRVKYTGQYWRLADGSLGWVHGIEGLNGIACVTDGVVLIVRTSQGKLFDCHLDNWVVEKMSEPRSKGDVMGYARTSVNANESGNSSISKGNKSSKKLLVLLEEFL